MLFIRGFDRPAWYLFFLLCGLTSVSFETYSEDSLIGIFRSTFMNTWALAMLLFAIYFPERWSVDKKIPWAKWILLVPLMFQISAYVIRQIDGLIGTNVIDLKFLFTIPAFGVIFKIINILSIGMFFAILSHKATSIKNPDSRRRLKSTVAGTIASMLPLFSIILYQTIIGDAKGPFFDIVAEWYAIRALVILLLFPITMAYVIVVQRAMNVSVVVRQGLQYAPAKNGVLVLQIILSIAVVLTAFSFACDMTTNPPQKIIFIALGVMSVFLIRLLADKN